MTVDQVRPLPIGVRPVSGEHYTSYLRRLAQANHLPPSALRVFVTADMRSVGVLQLDRLAALAGREPAALRRALTGLPEPHRRTPPTAPPTRYQVMYRRTRTRYASESHLAHDLMLATDELRQLDQLALFAAIRTDRAMGLRFTDIMYRNDVGEDLVQAALRGSRPRSAAGSRWTISKPAPTLDPVKDLIHRMHDQGMNCEQIWTCLVDDHQAAVSKPTVKTYLRKLRSVRRQPDGSGLPADQIREPGADPGAGL